MQIMVLVLLIEEVFGSQNKRLWLAEKLLKVGGGLLNSPGGKVNPFESLKAAAVRETKEELGIEISLDDLSQVALLHIYRDGQHDYDCYVFMTSRWSGDFRATPEMALPKSYPVTKIPYEHMMAADEYWLPMVLSGIELEATWQYNHDRTEVSSIVCHPPKKPF